MWNDKTYRQSATCSCENGKYFAGFIDDSVITFGEITDTIKIVSTKTVPTKSTLANFCILLAFLLITVALLMAVSIYPIKYRSKQKHLLPYTSQITN